jgi:deoxyribose-phosphate aldolase
MKIKIEDITTKELAGICDHTFLSLPATYAEQAKKDGKNSIIVFRQKLDNFLEETVNMEVKPYAVCVRSEEVRKVRLYLNENGGKDIKIASVVGFPDGMSETEVKVRETRYALKHGAVEIDMVLNYEKFKAQDFKYVENDIRSVTEAAHEGKALVKLILETSELDSEQIQRACWYANLCEVDFVKTSTGFSATGANSEDLENMRSHFSGGVKMSGGVKPENVKELLYAVSGQTDGYIDLDPKLFIIGEGGLLKGENSY